MSASSSPVARPARSASTGRSLPCAVLAAIGVALVLAGPAPASPPRDAASAADGFPSYQRAFPLAISAGKLASGDLDGDGHSDLAACEFSDDVVEIFVGDGSGGFTSQLVFDVGWSPGDLAIADFDQDGRNDLAVVLYSDRTIELYINQGGLQFAEARIFDLDWGAQELIAVDFNLDGYPDLATGTGIVLLNDQTGHFSISTIETDLPPTAIAHGDIDDDGDADLAVAHFSSDMASLLLNDGNGAFTQTLVLPTGDNPRHLAFGRLNSDPYDDLVCSNWLGDSISLSLTTGPATFAEPQTIPVEEEPRDCLITDLDHDGDEDVLVMESDERHMSILLNDGSGAFPDRLSAPIPYSSHSPIAEDFDADGRTDLVYVGNWTFVIFERNLGLESFTDPPLLPAGLGASSVDAGDVNDDGAIDVVVANRDDDAVAVFLNDGGGSFPNPLHLPTGERPYDVQLHDMNGDGRLDIVTADYAGATVSILVNHGDGDFAPPVSTFTGYTPNSLAIADFDMDGRPDIATANQGTGTFGVVLNQGGLTFSEPVELEVGVADSIVAGDVTGDGLPDIALNNGSLRVFPNLGGGEFLASYGLPVGSYLENIALDDMDGDGHLDVVFSRAHTARTAGVVFLLDNPRSMVIVEAPLTDAPASLMTADVNRDGIPDIISGSFMLDVIINHGDRTFAPVQSFPHAWTASGSAAGDFDGDGDVDIVRAIPAGDGLLILPNLMCPYDLTGDGLVGSDDLFELLGAWGPCDAYGGGSGDACPADLDGDGTVNASDLFMLLGNWGACETE